MLQEKGRKGSPGSTGRAETADLGCILERKGKNFFPCTGENVLRKNCWRKGLKAGRSEHIRRTIRIEYRETAGNAVKIGRLLKSECREIPRKDRK